MADQLPLFDSPPPTPPADPREAELARLREQNERLQADLARAPHWAEPRRKHKRLSAPPLLDYRAFLEHAGDCPTCGRVHEDLKALRTGELEDEPIVACSEGLRLIPMAELVFLEGGGGWDRLFGDLMLRQLIEHARRLQECGPDQHAGVAWSGGPVG